jgi:steroid 5-alpha reductase family enzyme
MPVGYLAALAGIAVSLPILMAMAWMLQQRTGNSGWVDTIWTFSVGLTGAGSALWPIGGAAPNARQWLVAGLEVIWSLRLGGTSLGARCGLGTIRAKPPPPAAANGASAIAG